MRKKYINILSPREFSALLEMFDIELSENQEKTLLHILKQNSLIFYEPHDEAFIKKITEILPLEEKQLTRLIAHLRQFM